METFWMASAGGVLIGTSVVMLLAGNGRIADLSCLAPSRPLAPR
jgi:uncharacterized membrane protein YedE/YeeE